MKYSKFIVALIIILNVAFTAAVIWLIKECGIEPTTLIAAWFAFTTGELFLVAGITKTKIKEGDCNDGMG